jgi:hypothetical protein
MWPPTPPAKGMEFKDKVATAQAIVTTAAVIIGGFWTYNTFIRERQEYPHANIEQKVSHVVLSDKKTVLRVEVQLSNVGTSQIWLGSTIVRVQQILPIPPCPKDGPCAASEVNDAIEKVVRNEDQFDWPLIAERTSDATTSIEIEPGEKQTLEFEFAVAAEIKVVRVYSYFRNEKLKGGREIGWTTSGYYNFRTPDKERAER